MRRTPCCRASSPAPHHRRRCSLRCWIPAEPHPQFPSPWAAAATGCHARQAANRDS
jgi:hypothetical protein